MKMKNRKCLMLFFAAAVVFVCSCQSLPVKSPEQALESRVASMMAARVDQDWAKVYDYFDPDYKEKISKKAFLNINRNVKYSNFEIQSIDIAPSGKQAVVVCVFDMSVMSFQFKGHEETQDWVKVGRKWYYKAKSGPPMGNN